MVGHQIAPDIEEQEFNSAARILTLERRGYRGHPMNAVVIRGGDPQNAVGAVFGMGQLGPAVFQCPQDQKAAGVQP